jgi:hypothetical protein
LFHPQEATRFRNVGAVIYSRTLFQQGGWNIVKLCKNEPVLTWKHVIGMRMQLRALIDQHITLP